MWKNHSEKGVALIIALLMILVISVLAASITFLAQTQSWTAMNYQQTAQARYAAEAGAQQTMNWLSSSSYGSPNIFTYFNLNTYPVSCSSTAITAGVCKAGPIVLSANTTGLPASNYPDNTSHPNPTGAMESSYSSALGSQSISSLIPGESFSTSATLLSMTQGWGVPWLGFGGGLMQTWQVTSVGNIANLRNAQVQVVATYTRSSTPIFGNALYALGNGCGTINFGGSFTTDSFTSAGGGTYSTTHVNSGGNICTNGNLTANGGGYLHGTLFDPRGNTSGDCSTSFTNNGGFSMDNGISASSTAWTYPTPNAPGNTPPNTAESPSSTTPYCGNLGSGCTASSSDDITLAPGTYGAVTFNGSYTVNLSAGTYNFYSLTFAGSDTINVTSGPVILNFATAAATPLDMTGATLSTNGPAANFQCVYGGTGNMIVVGASSNSAGVIYAPNAGVTLTGEMGWQGSIICNTFATGHDSTGIHWDQALQNSLMEVGNFAPVGFSWNKF